MSEVDANYRRGYCKGYAAGRKSVKTLPTEAGPSIEAINSARYVMYNARDFGEHEAILANEIMRLDVNASRSETGSIEPQGQR